MQDSVQHIWSDLHGELRGFIISRIKDPVLAEDLLQEVFIKVHLHLHQLKQPERLTAWVYQICRRVIADHFRQPGRTDRLPDPMPLAEADTEEELYAALSNCVNRKISRLSKKDREAILLAYFQNYSQKQLAEFLGLSYSGTKNRVQRARQKLKEDILDCENVQADPGGKVIGVESEKI